MPKSCQNCNEMNDDAAESCFNCNTPIQNIERGIVKKKKTVKAVINGVISVSPKSIEITELKRSEVKETYLLLSRADFESEQFSGTITPPAIPGFKLKADSFEGLRNVINIQIDAKQLKAGEVYEDFIHIQSDIGEAQIPVKLSISGDSPQLGVDFGQIQINMNNKETKAYFTVTNIGFGTLTGTAKTKTSWLEIEDPTFALEKDGSAEIEVTLDKKELKKFDRAGRMTLEGLVTLETNAGDEEIKVILYLTPVHSLSELKPYLPHAIVGVVLITLVVLAYPYVKKFMTPKEIPRTGLWGEMAGEKASKKMQELEWNPFSEEVKIVYTAIKGTEGKVDQLKIKKKEVTNIYTSQIDRLYTPAIAPNGFLVAIGIPGTVPELTEKQQNKYVDLTIANVKNIKPDRLTTYIPSQGGELSLAYDPVWSPDGMKLAFIKTSSADSLHGELLLIDHDNATPYTMSDLPNQGINLLCKEPKWSPDGKKILVEDLKKEIYVFEPQGREKPPVVLELTSMEQFEAFDPQWSPDGKNIIFSRSDGEEQKDKGELYTIKFDGTAMKSLVKHSKYEDMNPEYAPEGNIIAFDAKKYGANELRDIFVVWADGTGVKNITNTKDIDEEAPKWSPDGKSILYRAKEEGDDWELFLFDPEKAGNKDYKPLQLTNDDFEQGIPIWWTPDYYNNQLKLNEVKESKLN